MKVSVILSLLSIASIEEAFSDTGNSNRVQPNIVLILADDLGEKMT